MNYTLELELLSDATFGGGDGVAGLVDTEIEYDVRTGLPFLRGRTLRGLLVEECANVLFALEQQGLLTISLQDAAKAMFGKPGSGNNDTGTLHVGAAKFPEDVEAAIRREVNNNRLTPAQTLDLLTGIRRQTAVDYDREAPRDNSLRNHRFLLRKTRLYARLEFFNEPSDLQVALLAAVALSVRRAGSGRNRGRGKIKAILRDANANCPAIDLLFQVKEAAA